MPAPATKQQSDSDVTRIYALREIGSLRSEEHSDHGFIETAFAIIGNDMDDTFGPVGESSYRFNGPDGTPITVDVRLGA